MDKELIKCIAVDNGWVLDFEHEYPMIPLLRFAKHKKRIDIWFTTGTVSIMIKYHQAKYIKNCDIKKVEELLS